MWMLLLLLAQSPDERPARPASPPPKEEKTPEEKKPDERKDDKEKPEEPPVVTHHEARLQGRILKYSVTTGTMPLKNEKGEIEARIFFVAYVADRTGGPETRPLTFSFNGGPGSASVWLHMGALGPKRVKMREAGMMPAPPYTLVDNDATWLDQTDLVFIDPVGTGYSRAAKPELGAKFWGLQGDIESVGEFIRLYLSRYERWASPLFMVGESYGTTRAAGLSDYLVERDGIAFNGIILVSSILNFETARFGKGNDLPYQLFLPTYTASAWYHKKLPPDLQQQELPKVLKEVEAFAGGEYPVALSKGDRLTSEERKAVIARLARFTGLDPAYIDRADLRIEIQHFCKELLRDQKRTVGRLDTRFVGIDETAVEATPEYDPSLAAIRPPYTAMFNDYVRRTLQYKSDLHYFILGGGIGRWDWGPTGPSGADVSEALRKAFSKNPDMRLFVAKGHYDLATPYFATEYTLSHMGLDPSQRSRVTTGEYEAGHMMYISEKELAHLKADVSAFIHGSLQAP